MRHQLLQLPFALPSKIRALHSNTAILRTIYPTLSGYRTPSENIVSRYHAHNNPGPLAVLDSILHSWPQGVLDTEDSKQYQTKKKQKKNNHTRVILGDSVLGRPAVKVTE